MLAVPMRTFPGLFVGRRTVMMAQEVVDTAERTAAYRCGACNELILAGPEQSELRDVVVKCRCGEYNQI